MPEDISFLSPTVFLPLLAAIFFSLASVVVKAAANRGVDIWQTCFVSNIVTCLAFSPFLFYADQWPLWSLFWMPALVALLFVVGQVFTLVSMTKGEISVAAPVLGLKIIFVPIFLRLLGIESLPHTLWSASILATVGIILLNFNDRSGHSSRAMFSVICAGLGAAAYAMFDVCVQQFSHSWQQFAFLPTMLSMCVLISLGFIPFFQGSLRSIPSVAWSPLIIGSILFAIQALGIVCAIAFWGHAAAVNVVYSTRGLWGLILVWVLGRWLRASDTGLTKRTFIARLAGTICLLLAVIVAAM